MDAVVEFIAVDRASAVPVDRLLATVRSARSRAGRGVTRGRCEQGIASQR